MRQQTDSSRKRGCGATHCYGCLCDTCANSVELLSWYFTAGEVEEPCFTCDECRHYDGDMGKRDQWHGTCPRYIEAQKAAEARKRELERRAEAEEKRAQDIRATFKIIKGGADHV